jgi:hypothetical protein
VPTVAQPTDRLPVLWILTRESEHKAAVEFRLSDGATLASYPDLVVTGTPKLYVDGVLPTWSIVDKTDTGFALECPEVLPASAQWFLGPYDPAIRSSLGGYLTPLNVTIGGVVNLGIVAITRAGDFAVDVEFDNSTGSIITPQVGGAYLPVVPPYTFPGGLSATSFEATSATTARITFSSDITGDGYIEFADAGSVVTTAGAWLVQGSYSIA